MQRDSWPLLALSYAKDHRLSPVQMQKTLFLVGAYVVDDAAYYEFKPYHYGPFDSQVYSDLDELAERGLVRKTESRTFTGFYYELTAAGEQSARRARKHLNKGQTAYLNRVVPWVLSQTFSQLVSAIYKAFPKMREKSVFRY